MVMVGVTVTVCGMSGAVGEIEEAIQVGVGVDDGQRRTVCQ